MEKRLILKRGKDSYIGLLEKSADEIIIITPDLFWDLYGGFKDIVIQNILVGKKYTYIVWSKFEKRVEDFVQIINENIENKQHSGQLDIYIVEFPIIFEIAIYKIKKEEGVYNTYYIAVVERDSIRKIAYDLDIQCKDYKDYIDEFLKFSLDNFSCQISIPYHKKKSSQ